MKKTFKIIMTIIFVMMTVSATLKAQSFSTQIFGLNNPATTEAEKLVKFYEEGKVIEKKDNQQRVAFQMVCCKDTTIKIYFTSYNEKGEAVGYHCPVLILYRNEGKWYTNYSPAGYKGGYISEDVIYSLEQTQKQVEEITKALAYLKNWR